VAKKLVSDNILAEKLLLGEVVKGYHLSLRASRYSPSYIVSMEICLRCLADYARTHRWPEVSKITTLHIEEYLVYLQERPSQLGKRSPKPRLSASSVETHYRRLKTFFAWLKQRSYIEANPFDLIQHPKIEERVIPTVSDQQILDLLELVNPRHARTPAERFRALRNRAIIWLLVDTPIRRGELAQLTVDSVNLDAGTVKVMGKGRRERIMPLGETSLLALWDYLQVRNSRLSHL
jgi:site-specific recombinase XerD